MIDERKGRQTAQTERHLQYRGVERHLEPAFDLIDLFVASKHSYLQQRLTFVKSHTQIPIDIRNKYIS